LATVPTDPLSQLTALEGVASAMAAARDGIDALLRDRGLRRTTPEITTESLFRGAFASARLSGSTVTLDQLRAGSIDGPSTSALRVSTELMSLAPLLSRTPAQAFARLHLLAAGTEEAGRPTDAERAQRLRSLGEVLTAPLQAPALVVAAVVHAELATVRPFGSLDSVVARAAERMVLVERGVDPTSLTVPEAAHLRLQAEYESNLRGYAEGGPDGVRSWLLYASEAYALAAELSPLND
jgi:hypothetical protein